MELFLDFAAEEEVGISVINYVGEVGCGISCLAVFA
jgi:hypothetical protein